MNKLLISILLLDFFLLFNCHIKNNDKNEQLVQKKENSTEFETNSLADDVLKNKNVNKPDYSFLPEHVKTLEDSAKFLTHYFDQFININDSLSEIFFFKLFPDNFEEFNKLYGYDDEYGARLLYGTQHIMKYEKHRKYIALDKFIMKLINLSINGYWDADETGLLQEVIDINLFKSPAKFIQLLKTKSNGEIFNIWKFYFDGPHPPYIFPEDLLDTIDDDGILNTAKQALQEVQKEWKH